MSRSLLSLGLAFLLLACGSEVVPEKKPPVSLSGKEENHELSARPPAEEVSAKSKAETNPIDSIPGLETVTDPTFSIEKLIEKLGSLTADQLTVLGNQLLDSLQQSQADAKTLTDSISNLQLSEIAKAGELRHKLTATTNATTGLQKKLEAVVDAMRQKGVEVTKYTAALAALAGG